MCHCGQCRTTSDCPMKLQCPSGKQLWRHMLGCTDTRCGYPRCQMSKDLLLHFHACVSPDCHVCPGVRSMKKKAQGPQGAPEPHEAPDCHAH